MSEVSLLSTKVVPKREEVTIPNAVLAGTMMTNYSRLADENGRVMSTAVTIGYDAPWRQVHALLLLAAERTPGMRKRPAPMYCRGRCRTSSWSTSCAATSRCPTSGSGCGRSSTSRSRTRSTSSACRSCRRRSRRSPSARWSCRVAVVRGARGPAHGRPRGQGSALARPAGRRCPGGPPSPSAPLQIQPRGRRGSAILTPRVDGHGRAVRWRARPSSQASSLRETGLASVGSSASAGRVRHADESMPPTSSGTEGGAPWRPRGVS